MHKRYRNACRKQDIQINSYHQTSYSWQYSISIINYVDIVTISSNSLSSNSLNHSLSAWEYLVLQIKTLKIFFLLLISEKVGERINS